MQLVVTFALEHERLLLWQVYVIVIYISGLLHCASRPLICDGWRAEIFDNFLDLSMVIYTPLEITHGARDHHSSRLGINYWLKFLFVQVSLDVSIFRVAESNLTGLCVVAVLIGLLFMDLLVRQISS